MVSSNPISHRYQSTPQDRIWFRRRLTYYALQLAVFIVIIYRPGPNLFLFHSIFSPSKDSYIPLTVPYRPMIAAIKAYQRDFGKLPLDGDELPPDYQPVNFTGERGEILDTTSITFPAGKNVLEYEFSPEKEGWYIHAPRYDGRLPLPIVPAAPVPATRPASRPAIAF